MAGGPRKRIRALDTFHVYAMLHVYKYSHHPLLRLLLFKSPSITSHLSRPTSLSYRQSPTIFETTVRARTGRSRGSQTRGSVAGTTASGRSEFCAWVSGFASQCFLRRVSFLAAIEAVDVLDWTSVYHQLVWYFLWGFPDSPGLSFLAPYHGNFRSNTQREY